MTDSVFSLVNVDSGDVVGTGTSLMDAIHQAELLASQTEQDILVMKDGVAFDLIRA